MRFVLLIMCAGLLLSGCRKEEALSGDKTPVNATSSPSSTPPTTLVPSPVP